MENEKLKIIDMSQDGCGVAKTEDGLTVFIPFAIENEEVVVSKIEKHKNYAVAKLEKILFASPRRVQAPCPYYGICGGCQLQHLDYETQKLFKQLSLSQTFKRAELEYPVNLTKGGFEWAYRNNVELKVTYKDDDILIGFYVKGTNELIDIKECMVCGSWFKNVREKIHEFLMQTRDINQVENIYITCFSQNDEMNIQLNFQTTNGEIKKSNVLFELLSQEFKNISIYSSKQEDKKSTILNYKTCHYVYGEKYLSINYLKQNVELTPMDFFQINTSQSTAIFNYIKKQIEILQPDIFIDAFCGLGVLSMAVAEHCKEVYAIDINKSAVKRAGQKAKEKQLDNVHFFAGDCNKIVSYLNKIINQENEKNQKKCDLTVNFDELIAKNDIDNALFEQLLQVSSKKVIFLDPSRVGAGKNVLDFINANNFSDIFYLSCNPYSLVKDLKRLTNVYDIVEITPFDMFPQTSKIETLVHLKIKDTQTFELKECKKELVHC